MENFTIKLNKKQFRKDYSATINLCALKTTLSKFKEEINSKHLKDDYKDMVNLCLYAEENYFKKRLCVLSVSDNFNSLGIIIDVLEENRKVIVNMLKQMENKHSSILINAKVEHLFGDIHTHIVNDFKNSYIDSEDKDKNNVSVGMIDSFIGDDMYTTWYCRQCYLPALYPEDDKRIIYYYTKLHKDEVLLIKIVDYGKILDEDLFDHVLVNLIKAFYLK